VLGLCLFHASVLTIDINAVRLCHRQDCAGALRVVRSSLVMSGLLLRKCLWIGLVLSVLGLCLFGDGRPAKSSQVLGLALAEITAVLADPGTQWMVFVCAGTYFLGFVVLRRRLAGAGASGGGGSRIEDGGSRLRTAWGLAAQWLEEPAFWLSSLLVLGALAYGINYTEAVKITNALTLLGAAMIGQGAGLWESRKQKAESRNRASGTVVAVLIVLLVGAAVWQAEAGHSFQYRGQGRWSGPWDNPNTFGVLMGVGLVLAGGVLVQSPKSKVQSLRSKVQSGPEHPTSNIQRRTSNLAGWVRAAFFLAAAVVMGVGLVKSYSRGAWVGTVVALAYLFLKAESRKQKAEIPSGPRPLRWSGRRWVALAIVCASVGVLAFWGFRQAERGMVRRAYSVANANDFSWRNRVAAWEGALQMMAEKPWFGFGWNQPERVYDRYYRAAKVDEGMAIQMNDYFTLGTTLGLPALVCFALYVLLALIGQPRPELAPPQTLDFRLWTLDSAAVCRAGAVVLLVGFWFDGGLFKLATAAPFWILLELGRTGDHEIHEAHENG
jgi:O-antigen ligase